MVLGFWDCASRALRFARHLVDGGRLNVVAYMKYKLIPHHLDTAFISSSNDILIWQILDRTFISLSNDDLIR